MTSGHTTCGAWLWVCETSKYCNNARNCLMATKLGFDHCRNEALICLPSADQRSGVHHSQTKRLAIAPAEEVLGAWCCRGTRFSRSHAREDSTWHAMPTSQPWWQMKGKHKRGQNQYIRNKSLSSTLSSSGLPPVHGRVSLWSEVLCSWKAGLPSCCPLRVQIQTNRQSSDHGPLHTCCYRVDFIWDRSVANSIYTKQGLLTSESFYGIGWSSAYLQREWLFSNPWYLLNTQHTQPLFSQISCFVCFHTHTYVLSRTTTFTAFNSPFSMSHQVSQ